MGLLRVIKRVSKLRKFLPGSKQRKAVKAAKRLRNQARSLRKAESRSKGRATIQDIRDRVSKSQPVKNLPADQVSEFDKFKGFARKAAIPAATFAVGGIGGALLSRRRKRRSSRR